MKIGFLSLGCPKNLVDGEVMLGLAQQAGHEITTEAAGADVLIVNTCAFIDSAKQESVDAILEMAAHRRQGRCSRLVVTGCLAERYRDDLRNEIPEIDALLGTGEVDQILSALGAGNSGLGDSQSPAPVPVRLYRPSEFAESERRPFDTLTVVPSQVERRPPNAERRTPARELPTYLYDADTPRLLTTPRHFAYVKVAEGCDYTCAFCIIPSLRGKYRSRAADSILREARALAARGVRELLLVSQDTTFFGIDRGERGALARLLRELNAVDGLRWIRLLYLYPTTITDDVLAAMADCEKVCRYVDLPLQHASTAVLRRMRRPGTRATYTALLERIRRRVPGVTLRTTLIVGFPGETDRDFAELEAFVGDIQFDHLGVFTYSHEEGTHAVAFPDDVPAGVKRRRRHAVMAEQKRIVARAQKSRIGSVVDLMIDGPSPEHELVLQGRLEGQAPEIDPIVVLSEADPATIRPGELIRARITGARGYDLVATPVHRT